MDNNNQNFGRPTQAPQTPRPKKQGGVARIAVVAAVAALVGGGVGGGVAYWYAANNTTSQSLGVVSTTQKAGTTQVSNVSVNESSASQTAFAKVKKAVVSVINLQKAQSTSSGLDSFGDLFGYGSDSSDGTDANSGASQSTDGSDSGSSSSSSSGSLEEYSEGSGVIYQKKDGKAYIVTNNHVVADSDALEVILSDGTKLTAKLVGTDSETDLAVLSISADKVSTVASFGDSSKIAAGQTVLAIGSPLGSQYATSVTQGIISATSRTVDVTDEDTGTTTGQATVIQTDAAINSGNSGGPLINLSGQVIGINSMKLSSSASDSSTATIEGMGFAIPSDEVVSIINQLVANGKVVRPALGVTVRDLSSVSSEQQSSILKIPSSVTGGVVVAGFTNTSIAQKAGIKQYDVITAIGDTKVTSIAELHTALYKYAIGDTVKITFYHQSTKKTVSLKLSQTTDQLSTSSSSSSSNQ
ncbi:S1C family serine protease [Lacticaseibacillus parakribbianus]|uniref:S1C family serine protease n=1 Tax=Lacticaseibacillus parakribbianus TaxID=2970927 RepID=UPI0021CB0433|nr:trypsin-like peptidase domain-containing protein [Lacticaseibacillus parakribbianus]